jgi:hypothetical protein
LSSASRPKRQPGGVRSAQTLGLTNTEMHPRREIRWLGVTLFALASIYAVLGVLQALSLYQGERALWNVNLWASLALVAGVMAWQVAPKAALTSRMSTWRRVIPWLQAGLALYFAWQVLRHLVAVDACLDHGGSFDYLAGVCNMQESMPYVPLHRTHGFPIVATLVLGLLAVRRYLHLRNARRGPASEA